MSKKNWLSTLTALGLLGGASFAQACTLGAWQNSSGTPLAGGNPEAVARYSGECAMQTSDGYVQDYSPAAETRMISRFYIKPTGSGAATIYSTFSDQPAAGAAGTTVYTVEFDGSSNQLTFTAGAQTTDIAVNAGAWNSVEIDWQSGSTMSIWVNSDAATAASPTATLNSVPAGSIDAARLGADAVSGSVTLTFDDYEARRTTAVGRVKLGDADGDGTRELSDAVLLLNEFLAPGATTVTGQIDADENGTFGLSDAVTTLNLFLTQGA